MTNKLNSQTNGLLKKNKYLIGTKLALNSSKWILNFYSPEPIIYSGDHDPSLPHEPQRLVPPLESFEYQGDLSSQLTEGASKIIIYLHYIFSCRVKQDSIELNPKPLANAPKKKTFDISNAPKI